MGITDIEDSFKRLDNLIEEEVRMAIAQTLKEPRLSTRAVRRPFNQVLTLR
jgi:hypothetical protein